MTGCSPSPQVDRQRQAVAMYRALLTGDNEGWKALATDIECGACLAYHMARIGLWLALRDCSDTDGYRYSPDFVAELDGLFGFLLGEIG